MSAKLLSGIAESLTSVKSLIIHELTDCSSSLKSVLFHIIQLTLKLFDTGDRLPDFANIAHPLVRSLST